MKVRSNPGTMTGAKPVCFIACPIGDEGTAVRKRSDNLYKFVFAPVLRSCGYAAVRADHIDIVGDISAQVIRHLLDAPMVLADLSGHNANVFYELGIRHAAGKPYILIIDKEYDLPFDIAHLRVVHIDLRDPQSVDDARERLKKQIKEYQAGAIVESPVSGAQPNASARPSKGRGGTTRLMVSPLDAANSRWQNMTSRMNRCRKGELVRFISITGRNFLLPEFQVAESVDSRLGPKALKKGVKLQGVVLDPKGAEAEFRSRVESPEVALERRLLFRDAKIVEDLPTHYKDNGIALGVLDNLTLRYSKTGLSFGLWLFSDIGFVEPFHFGKRDVVPHLCGFAQLGVEKGTEEFYLLERHFAVLWKNGRSVSWSR